MQDFELLQQKYTSMISKKLDEADCNFAVNCLLCETDFAKSDAQVFRKFSFLPEEVIDLADVLVKVDKIYLRNFIKSQLWANQIPALMFFFSKVFVSHIGSTPYVSKNANMFDMGEKTFDKFMEACIYTKIDVKEIFPCMFEILKAAQENSISKWKRPVIDFLVDYATKNEKQFLNTVFENFNKLGIDAFNFLLNQGISYAIPRLTDFWLDNEFSLKRQVKNILKQHFAEVYDYMLSLEKENKISSLNQVLLMSIFKIEKKAKEKLISIYLKEKDDNIKKLILQNVAIDFKADVLSGMQFRKNCLKFEKTDEMVFLGKNICEYPVLKYEKADEGEICIGLYILSEYSKLLSPYEYQKLGYFLQFVDNDTLDEFAEFVFSLLEMRGFVEQDDWALLLVGQNSSKSKLVELFKRLSKYKKVPVFVVNKLVKLLCIIKREDLVECALMLDRQNKKEYEIIQTIFLKAEQSGNYELNEIENARDLFAQSYGFDFEGNSRQKGAVVSIDENLEVSATVEVVDDLVENYAVRMKKNIEREIDKQSARLYRAFLCARKWTKTDFEKIFLKQGLLNVLAQRLVFGAYQSGNLIGVFEILEDKINFIESLAKGDDEPSNVKYGIFHPVEYPDNDFANNFYRGKPPFNQLKREISLQTRYNIHASSVSRFNGMVVSVGSFFKRLYQSDWFFGLPTFDNYTDKMLKYNRDLDMVCEISFEPIRIDGTSMQTTVLNELRFYRAKNVICTGNNWVPNKLDSLEIGSIDARLFSDIIYELVSAGKK